MSFWSQSSGPSGAGAYNAGASTSFGGSSYNAAPPAHGSPGPWGGPSHAPYGSGAPSGLYGGGPSTPGASTGSPFFVSQPPSHQPAQFGFSSSYMSQPGGFDASGAAPSQQQQPSFFGGGMPMQQAPQQYFASTSKPAPGSPWGQQYSSPAKDATPGRGSPKASPPTQSTPSHSGIGYGYSSRIHSGRESIGRQHSNLRHASEDHMDDDAPPTASALGSVHDDDVSMTAEPSSFDPSPYTFAARHQSGGPASTSSTEPSSDAANAVIVFGFSPEHEPLVRRHFAALGDVRSVTPGVGGNWLTIAYAEPATALRAVRLHGELIGPNLMIAVKLAQAGGGASRAAATDEGRPATPSTAVARTVPKSPEPAIGARAAVLPAASALRRAPTSSRLFGLFAAGSEPPSSPKPALPSSAPSTPAPAAPSTPSGLRGVLLDRIFGFCASSMRIAVC